MRLSHYSSVAISLILNTGLFALLLTFLTLSEPQNQVKQTIKVIEANETLEDIQEVEDIIPPEDVQTTDQSEPTTLDMKEMIAEQLDTSVPQEEAPIASPVVSPVIMQGLAQAMGGVSLGGIGDGTKRTTRFMGQSGEGNRFAFVIDYSRSMSDLQLRVMKHELTTALAAIGEGGLATVLFFSGPVWRPDEDALEVEKKWSNSGAHSWQLKKGEEGPNPKWLVPNRKNMAALQRMIYETPTTYGTDWFPPIKEALDMKPRPDIIFFMTDGRTSETSENKAVELVKSLPKGSIQVNTVALGVKEEDVGALKTLAGITNGNFRHYTNTELKEVSDKLPDPPDDFSKESLTYLSIAEVRSMASRGKSNLPPPVETDVVSFEID